ncbi:TPA: VOC family protein [Stenotrophomonas maltophilia]|uniref:VOC family protein n=1 Tax=Stenotrophomonas maltophilia TaxID=40324 RepID=UPI000C1518C1|nr:VOC family protein [Stenotrophomonas maltophilia]MBH1386516.1 VOC family protein [Stenotrophomonas maltophilia]MBN5106042.1 VOC family protein [Stenotrophomonas maltophilia]MCM2521043.1 VOC family protein [Stenotrophomonas maltophilia]PZS98134.1 lactoylglutathione lyase [Stenotrophomonas maltophilia]HDX0803326.1 VOC family protein [Stenotrophomonas maltophilia]
MNPILHVEIPASDLDRAITFYQRWLQVAVDEPVVLHDCRMAYLPFSDEDAGASIALVLGADYRPSEQGARVYIGVDDLDASLERALQAGAELCFGPADAGDWRVAEIRDSEGNRIALQARAAL